MTKLWSNLVGVLSLLEIPLRKASIFAYVRTTAYDNSIMSLKGKSDFFLVHYPSFKVFSRYQSSPFTCTHTPQVSTVQLFKVPSPSINAALYFASISTYNIHTQHSDLLLNQRQFSWAPCCALFGQKMYTFSRSQTLESSITLTLLLNCLAVQQVFCLSFFFFFFS